MLARERTELAKGPAVRRQDIELRGFSKGEEENGGFRGKGELEREESGAC